MIIKHGRHTHEVRKGVWAFFSLGKLHCMEGPITEFNCSLTLTLLFWTFFFRTLTFDMLQSILRKRQ